MYTLCTITALALHGGFKGTHIPLYKYKYHVNSKLQITFDMQKNRQTKNINLLQPMQLLITFAIKLVPRLC